MTIKDLTTLHYEPASNEYTPVLSDIVNYCFNLTCLTIESCPLLNVDFRIYDELCKRIHTLKLRNLFCIFPSTLANRNRLHSKRFARMISQFTNLRHLEITNAANVTRGNIMRVLKSMPNVKHVNIEKSVFVNPHFVVEIMSACPAIEIFHFSHQQFITVRDQQHSLRQWYHLTRMYYPWIRFSEILTCQIEYHLTSKKKNICRT